MKKVLTKNSSRSKKNKYFFGRLRVCLISCPSNWYLEGEGDVVILPCGPIK